MVAFGAESGLAIPSGKGGKAGMEAFDSQPFRPNRGGVQGPNL
jgi:hypothetical protein